MKLLAFSVYDEKAECFGHPFFVSAIGIATRYFSEWTKDTRGMVGKHPEDFTLYHVGEWNDSEAKFANITAPKFIAKGTDYEKKPEMYSTEIAQIDREKTA